MGPPPPWLGLSIDIGTNLQPLENLERVQAAGYLLRYTSVVNSNGGTQRQFSENICSEDDLSSRIFGTFSVKFLAFLPLLGFSNI